MILGNDFIFYLLKYCIKVIFEVIKIELTRNLDSPSITITHRDSFLFIDTESFRTDEGKSSVLS